MPKHSAGILLYRRAGNGIEVLLVHPGGPFWAKRDLGTWSMPKGEFGPDEEPFMAARREFAEEVGADAPAGDYALLGEFKQPSGKIVHAFALESDFNLEAFRSNMVQLEWPPKSGRMQEFPEVDRAAWTPLSQAREKVVKGQVPAIDALARQLGQSIQSPPAQASLF